MKSIKVLSVVACLVLICSIAYAKLYKWVDENGVTHYSNTAPPQSSEVETKEEVKGHHSPATGSQDLDDVLDSYREDRLDHAIEKRRGRSSGPSGKSDRLANYYEARLKKQEIRISDIETDLNEAKRESYSDSDRHKKKVRRYESRLEKAKIELDRLKAEYQR